MKLPAYEVAIEEDSSTEKKRRPLWYCNHTCWKDYCIALQLFQTGIQGNAKKGRRGSLPFYPNASTQPQEHTASIIPSAIDFQLKYTHAHRQRKFLLIGQSSSRVGIQGKRACFYGWFSIFLKHLSNHELNQKWKNLRVENGQMHSFFAVVEASLIRMRCFWSIYDPGQLLFGKVTPCWKISFFK